MKKIMVSISLALILGLLVVIPGSTQMQTSSEEVGPSDATSLRLLIAINRLELTQSQMRQVHDILAGLLDEATALEADRDAFAQEMLLFSGSADELNARLTSFAEQMKDKAASLQESAQGALDEIKGILTVKQGEILRESFMPMHDRMWVGKAGLTGMRDRRRTQGEQLTSQGRGRMGQQFRTQLEDEASGPIVDRIREFIDRHPEMRAQMAQRFGVMNKRPSVLSDSVGRSRCSKGLSSTSLILCWRNGWPIND